MFAEKHVPLGSQNCCLVSHEQFIFRHCGVDPPELLTVLAASCLLLHNAWLSSGKHCTCDNSSDAQIMRTSFRTKLVFLHHVCVHKLAFHINCILYRLLLFLIYSTVQLSEVRKIPLLPYGLMDKASPCGGDDCRFEPCWGRLSKTELSMHDIFLPACSPRSTCHSLLKLWSGFTRTIHFSTMLRGASRGGKSSFTKLCTTVYCISLHMG